MNTSGPGRLGVRGPRARLGYGIAVGGTGLVAAGLLGVRGHVSTTNVALAFLVVVVAAAANGGLAPGALAAVLGFLAFDVLFIPPYGTLLVSDRQDDVSLVVYFLIAVVVSALVGAREERRIQAERRERETHTLYELAAGLVAKGGLDEVLDGVVRTIRSLFDLAGCAIVLHDARAGSRLAAKDGDLPPDLLAGHGDAPTGVTAAPPELAPGLLEPGRALTVPLIAAGAEVGALVVVAGGAGAAQVGPTEQRVLATFANQAALAVQKAEQDEARARAQALEATDRLRGALLNSVSHDLRTPLASIKASASSLLEPEVTFTPDERREFLRTIDQEADRLTHLVHNLLDMSRIEAGAVDPHLTEVWLPDLVGAVVGRARRPPVRQLIDVDVPESLPAVLADPIRLDQIMTNLLDNARRYAGEGLVRVVGRAPESAVELRVVDHGPGIPEAEQERVFNQFYRLQADGQSPDGTGMGLAICRGLAEAMGGSLRAETAPGGGAALVLRLPASQREGIAEPLGGAPMGEEVVG